MFAGLPGTGKTTLAQAIARRRGAAYLRIDTIEQALRDSGALAGEVGVAGYAAAMALAASNLRLGHVVVADAVNPVVEARAGWRAAAAAAAVPLIEVELICSDPAEHRRRVETRAVDIPGLRPPSWSDVQDRHIDPWPEPHIVLDTAALGPDALVALLEPQLAA